MRVLRREEARRQPRGLKREVLLLQRVRGLHYPHGDGYKITDDVCLCADGYTQDETTGECKASSASPLAVALICALIVSVVASVATAAVVLKRKAAATRDVFPVVSDAL